jgi:ammonia channel protein AmtB
MAIGYWTPLAHQFFARSGLSDTVHLASGIVGMLATIVFAAYMLRGANWARWLYLAWVSFGAVSSAFLASSLLLAVPGAIKTLVIGYFLTRRDANLFFSGRSPTTGEGGVREGS